MEANLSVCVCCMKDVIKGWSWKRDEEGEVKQCPKGYEVVRESQEGCMLEVPEECPYWKEHEAAIKAENKAKEKKHGSRLPTKV